MKRILFIGMLALVAWACAPVQKTAHTSATLKQSSQDSTEYEIVIIDAQFDLWYQLNFSPSKDYSNAYYSYKNLVAVGFWNDFYKTGQYPDVISCYIDYRPGIDYGIEVNRKLYWYFRYIQSEYKIPLFG